MNVNVVEDRIRIDAVDAGGSFQAIWLTRRLAERFVPHLATKAELQVESGLPREIVLSMDQQQLRDARASNPTPPVAAPPDLTPWLCVTIHLSERPEGLIWTLTGDRLIDAHMVLTPESVRALLDILLTSFRALEWGEVCFPEWLISAATPNQVPRVLN